MQRRDLFSTIGSSFRKKNEPIPSIIRPPYYKEESLFLNNCHKCIEKDCQKVCEVNIIKIQNDGTPMLDFSESGCTYCDECALACTHDVLILEDKKNINAKFSIGLLECLSWQQTMCFSCKDPCLEDAIKFLGLFKPEIDENLCTSCGFCVKVCPSEAITFKIISD